MPTRLTPGNTARPWKTPMISGLAEIHLLHPPHRQPGLVGDIEHDAEGDQQHRDIDRLADRDIEEGLAGRR